jgi:hypothetical protein
MAEKGDKEQDSLEKGIEEQNHVVRAGAQYVFC